MLKPRYAITLCLALAACATPYEWVKPGMTAATRDADVAGCASKVSHLAKDDVEAVPIVDRCMADRGYEKKAAR